VTIQKDHIFIGLDHWGDPGHEWIFGCPEENLSELGFVHSSYLQFQKERQRQ